MDSFSELIDKGVREDVHPAGVQVMLWTWKELFGQEEWVLRIPFLLAGFLSIFLIYRLGKLLIHDSAGLLAAGLFATTEYGIYHSLSLRPYIIGVCVLLVLSIQLVKLSRDEAFSVRRIIYLSLTGALCGYVHYFASLVAVIMILSSAMLMNRSQRKYLLMAIGGMALVVSPSYWHLPGARWVRWFCVDGGSGAKLLSSVGWISPSLFLVVWPGCFSGSDLAGSERWNRSITRNCQVDPGRLGIFTTVVWSRLLMANCPDRSLWSAGLYVSLSAYSGFLLYPGNISH